MPISVQPQSLPFIKPKTNRARAEDERIVPGMSSFLGFGSRLSGIRNQPAERATIAIGMFTRKIQF